MITTIAYAAASVSSPTTSDADPLDGISLNSMFGDPAALKRLETIIHPMVGAAQKRFLLRHRREPVVILDQPLLFEMGGADKVDVVVVVSASPQVQAARVLARPGMTPEKFAAILRQQMPDAEKRALADIVIPTGCGRQVTRRAVKRLVACLKAPGRRYARHA